MLNSGQDGIFYNGVIEKRGKGRNVNQAELLNLRMRGLQGAAYHRQDVILIRERERTSNAGLQHHQGQVDWDVRPPIAHTNTHTKTYLQPCHYLTGALRGGRTN